MENLIRIKLDPGRGEAEDRDFLRPCFRLSNWPSEQVEVWIGDEGGSSWEKVAEEFLHSSYNPENKHVFVMLLFDIPEVAQLAFFGSGGHAVSVGWTLLKHDQVCVGWMTEGIGGYTVSLGWQCGSEKAVCVPCGWTTEGVWKGNTPLGHTIKWPNLSNVPVGHVVADPADKAVRIGFALGSEDVFSVQAGATVMGLAEFGMNQLVLDAEAIAALCSGAAVAKQKSVILSGTDPEELD